MVTATLLAMDLTPDAVRNVELRKKGRGYDADDVDAFRQQVEIGAGEMQARLREAAAKIEEAETRAREAEERSRTSVESDETIQRTLLLAQRTADAAVKEAEETAARKVADAEAEAERLLTEARNHREQAIADAESEVREAIDLKRAELLDELSALERTRDGLHAEVVALEAHVDAQRGRVQEARDLLGAALDQPLAPVAVPEAADVAGPEPEPASEPDPAPAVEPVLGAGEPAAAGLLVELDDGESDDEPAAAEGDDPWEPAPPESVFAGEPAESAPEDDPWAAASEEDWAQAPPPPPPPPPPDFEADDAAWAEAPPPPPPPPPDFEAPAQPAEGPGASFGGLSGPAATDQLPDLDQQDEDENPWLAELSDHEATERDRSRFGRRR